jgi:hypothetical protein
VSQLGEVGDLGEDGIELFTPGLDALSFLALTLELFAITLGVLAGLLDVLALVSLGLAGAAVLAVALLRGMLLGATLLGQFLAPGFLGVLGGNLDQQRKLTASMP